MMAPCLLQAFPTLPAFREDPNNVHFEGKLLWMDLFTIDVEAEVDFYTGLFGWEAEELTEDFASYTLLKNNGKPVAGVIYRPAAPNADVNGIWMPYFSVKNIKKSIKRVTKANGRVAVGLNEIPDRGKQVVVRDREGALFGLMQSTSGDPDDIPGTIGDFVWTQLYVRDLDDAVDFYTSTLGYETEESNEDQNVYARLFKSGDKYRSSLMRLPEKKPEIRPMWLGLVLVENVQDVLDRAEDLGGRAAWGPEPDFMDGRIAVVEDPAGAAVIIIEKEEEVDSE